LLKQKGNAVRFLFITGRQQMLLIKNAYTNYKREKLFKLINKKLKWEENPEKRLKILKDRELLKELNLKQLREMENEMGAKW